MDDKLSYMYAARELAYAKARIENSDELTAFIDRFEGKTEKDYLESTFVSTREDSPFASSGIIPVKLVCAYIWIVK